MEWRQVEGSQTDKPLELDKVSSSTTVYLRRNIKLVEKEDEDGNTYNVWQYDEVQMSKADYAIYVAENAQANAEYIAMMSDIDLDI